MKIIILHSLLACLFFLPLTAQQLFKPPMKTTVNGNAKIKFTPGDFDGNGLTDIIYVSQSGKQYSLGILQNDSLAYSVHPLDIPKADSLEYRLADLNNDHQLDIIIASKISDKYFLNIYLGNGNFTFQQFYKTAIPTFNTPLISDFNNDGRKDLFFNGYFKDTSCFIVLQATPDNFKAVKTSIPLEGKYKSISLDADTNGRPDVYIVADDKFRKNMLYTTNNLKFTATAYTESQVRNAIMTIGDLNDDGNNDILQCGIETNGKRSWKGIIQPEGSTVIFSNLPAIAEGEILLADFNHDGQKELFIHGTNEKKEKINQIFTLKNGKFTIMADTLPGNPSSVCVADFDRNGNLDVMMSDPSGNDSIQILFDNLQVNTAPAVNVKRDANALLVDSLLFLFWDLAQDDSTPQKDISYDIFLGGGISSGEIQKNWHRIVSRQGSNGTKNYFFINNKNLSPKTLLNILPVDNAFHSSFYEIGQGGGGGECVLGDISTNFEEAEIFVCESATRVFRSKSGKPALFFSSSRGILGKATELTVKITGPDKICIIEVEDTSIPSLVYKINYSRKIKFQLGPDKEVCNNAVIEIPVNNAGGNLRWTINNKEVKTSGPLSYTFTEPVNTLTVSSIEENCTTGDTVIIRSIDSPTVSYAAEYLKDGKVNIAASGSNRYQWSYGNGKTATGSLLQVMLPEDAGQYLLTGINDKGCSNTIDFIINKEHDLFIPELFSPNKDGNNDLFQVFGKAIEDIHFQVVNRNGVKVFETTEFNNTTTKGWDGTFNSELQPEGIYFWNLSGRYSDGSPFESEKTKGVVRLIR